jgi:hypothetical protein
MSRRLAHAATRFLDRRSARRGFLTSSAVVGSALAVAPVSYVLRPGTAYAQICRCNGSDCGCGQLCCDGYTEFCCTLYGTNGCPPGSLYGGWWRVSGSSYCGGSNRYYLDCHNPCGGCGCGASGVCSGSCNGTRCGCGLGNCANRKAGCTHFRYGQCNQQERCLGPIICRVVTCTPPWVLEPNCTRSVRTDPATAWHHRPCLEQTGAEPMGSLDSASAEGQRVRVVGWAFEPDRAEPLDVDLEVGGRVVATVRADRYRPDVGVTYPTVGEHHGFAATISVPRGTTQVCAYAVGGNGRRPLVGCATVRTAERSTRVALEDLRMRGDTLRLSGYAAVVGGDTPMRVVVRVDGTIVARGRAGRARPELARILGTRDHGGFDMRIRLPRGTGSGRATVTVTAVDPATGERTRIARRVLPAEGPS